jgi:hypothetical protein
MRNGGFRVVAALVLIGLVAALTGGAYAAGYSAGTASGAANVSPWIYGGAFGVSHVIGFIITIFVLLLILRLVFFGAFGHRHRAWGYRGGWGNTEAGDWHRGPWYEARQNMFDDLHRRAHEGQPQGGQPQGGQPQGGQPQGPAGPFGGPAAPQA